MTETPAKKRLRKLRLSEVSLVTQGADENATISIFKNKEGKKMTDINAIAAQMAAATTKITELTTLVEKQGAQIVTLTVERDNAVRKAVLAEAAGGKDDEDAILKAADPLVAAEILKLRKANAASAKALADIAEAEDVRKFTEDAAANFSNLATSPKDLGPVMKRASTLLAKEDFDLLHRVLKAADAATEAAMKATGMNSILIRKGSAEAEIEKLATEKATRDNVTFAKAYDDILVARPDLYKKFLSERGTAN